MTSNSCLIVGLNPRTHNTPQISTLADDHAAIHETLRVGKDGTILFKSDQIFTLRNADE